VTIQPGQIYTPLDPHQPQIVIMTPVGDWADYDETRHNSARITDTLTGKLRAWITPDELAACYRLETK